jgi:hypothetical protein
MLGHAALANALLPSRMDVERRQLRDVADFFTVEFAHAANNCDAASDSRRRAVFEQSIDGGRAGVKEVDQEVRNRNVQVVAIAKRRGAGDGVDQSCGHES